MEKYEATFILSNEVSEERRNIICQEFIDLRDVFINRINGYYNSWNEKYDELYPNNEVGYYEYIKTRMEQYIGFANLDGKEVHLAVDDDCDIYGIADDTEIRVVINVVEE